MHLCSCISYFNSLHFQLNQLNISLCCSQADKVGPPDLKSFLQQFPGTSSDNRRGKLI